MLRGRPHVATISLILVATVLAGCVASPENGGALVEIRMWVEPVDWEIHPNVFTPVWAFCAEGDGVEPVHEGACGVPAPTIHVTRGDTVRLTFENTHSIPHTVHFHGWHGWDADMTGNSLMGDHMVVDPGETQTIEWIAEPAGSFIYHCHFETPTHMDMGMYGAFIVDDPDERRDVDKHFVTVLDEWAVHNETQFIGSSPVYNYFTINGKSFPLTQPLVADPGDHVRIHMVNAGYQFHAMHIHGYTPDSWEGIAGARHAVPTDVREIAPGQTVVLDFEATREGIWLFHDHVVHTVTGAADGAGFGAYPRGMLTVLVVGNQYLDALIDIAPTLLGAAQGDTDNPPTQGNAPDTAAGSNDTATRTIDMKDFAFADKQVTIPAGTMITWRNLDGVVHTATADDGSFDSGNIAAGASWSHTFDTPGTYTYHCIPHAYDDDGEMKGMVATLIVEEP